MATDFPSFSSLPTELRLHIWRLALTTSWSCTSLKRLRKHQYKTVGTHLHKAVSQSCSEARDVLAKTHTFIEGMGWFNFSQHIIFLRDESDDLWGAGPQHRVQSCYALFDHVQHIVVSASESQQMAVMLNDLSIISKALKTIVIIAPWLLPKRDTYDGVLDWLPPGAYWGSAWSNSPTEVNLTKLVKALERGGKDGNQCLAHGLSLHEYESCLDKYIQRLPNPLSNCHQPDTNVYYQTRCMLGLVYSLMGKFVRVPKLYLQTVKGIRA